MARFTLVKVFCDGCKKKLYEIVVIKGSIIRESEPKPLYCAKCAGRDQ